MSLDIIVLDNLGVNSQGNEVRLVRVEQNGESYEAEMTVQRWMDISTKNEPPMLVPLEYSIKRVGSREGDKHVMLDLSYNVVSEVYELV